MATLTLKYNPRNRRISNLLDAVSQMKGIEVVYPDDELSPEEMKDVEMSLKSGILYDIDKLQAKLRY